MHSTNNDLQTRGKTNPFENGVLVVDDNPEYRQKLVAWLQSRKIETITEAHDGKSALASMKIQNTLPDVVILDLEMPGMDGVEFLQHLEEEKSRPAIVIITSADEILIASVATMIEAMGFTLLGSFHKTCDESFIDKISTRYREKLHHLHKLNYIHSETIDYQSLKTAIHASKICPFYQPKVDLQTGKCVGLEALARWWDPLGNAIPPDKFIPLAEKFDLINELTIDLIDRIIGDITYWKLNGFEFPVSVNISPRSLCSREFTNHLITLIDDNKIKAKLITFEITEGLLVERLGETLANTNRLRLKNFSFSIDDFGKGFSTMEKLSQFPFTELKIDRSFIKACTESSKSYELLDSLITIGKRLGITTVAEGVENIQQLYVLKELHCDQVQGNYFCKPVPSHLLLSWVMNKQE